MSQSLCLTTPPLSTPTTPIAAAFFFGIGDTWPMPITYRNPDNADGSPGIPIDLTGSIVEGVLFTRAQPIGIPLTVANGMLRVDAPNGLMLFAVNEQITKQFASADCIPQFAVTPYVFQTRLQVRVRDSLGNIQTIAVFPIQVFHARFVTPETCPIGQVGSITANALQGPPGAAGITSINGFTNSIVILGAHDVGTYSQAEIDAKIQAVMGAAFSLIARSQITAFSVVCGVGNAMIDLASSDTLSDMGNVLGIVSTFTASSDLAPIANNGVLKNPAWSWLEGPIYLGSAGALTQIQPSSGFMQQVGIAVGATTIVVALQPPTQIV